MTAQIQAIDAESAIDRVYAYLRQLQNQICQMIEQEDGHAQFREDEWQHAAGGGGYTRILTAGKVIEKAGVNFSHVHGTQLPQAAMHKRPHLQNPKMNFQALGISLVIHPINPYVPTVHANLRFILAGDDLSHWWFGGGFDLTPYYGFIEDCQHWHQVAKSACQVFGDNVYPHFKNWCDEYFYLKHRSEPRGIGGIFFDDLNNLHEWQWDFEKCFAFMQSIGNHFNSAYQPIIERRKNHVYGEKEKQFQLYRRGRYVEFNLLYDRGTLFGLQSQGRTESILMSLPPQVTWNYDFKPEPGSKEAELYELFLKPRDW